MREPIEKQVQAWNVLKTMIDRHSVILVKDVKGKYLLMSFTGAKNETEGDTLEDCILDYNRKINP